MTPWEEQKHPVLLPKALATGHPWLVKVHTKRSPDKPGGARMGQELLRALATPEAPERIDQRFAAEPAVQLVVPRQPRAEQPAPGGERRASARAGLLHAALNPCTGWAGPS